MITPVSGVAFSGRDDGDQRNDPGARHRLSAQLGIDPAWAVVDQIHGGRVVAVSGPGNAGEADAVVTTAPATPVAVFTADCLGIVLRGGTSVGAVHAGWRGLAAGVVEEALEVIASFDTGPVIAFIGPGIRSCCFEVGSEVLEAFADSVHAETTWGTPSVDLVADASRRLAALDVTAQVVGSCTMCGGEFSHRRDGSPGRLVALGWVA